MKASFFTERLLSIQSFLNRFHPDIKFIMKEEKLNEILIRRHDYEEISTNVYRKNN